MPNTHGFQIGAEVSVKFLREILKSAWESGGKKQGEPLGPGTFPHSLDIPPGTPFGSFVVQDGHVEIPKNQLDIALEPNKGVKIIVGVTGHAELQNAQNPNVASIKLQDITAKVEISAPIGPLTGGDHGPHDIGVQLTPAPATKVTLTGPDPAARLDQLINEELRSLAAKTPSLPPTSGVGVVYHSVPAYTVGELLEMKNDSTHQIDVVRLPGTPSHLVLKVPVRFSLYGINPQPGLDPPPPLLEAFVVEARLVASAVLEDDLGSPGGFLVRINAPTTTLGVEAITPEGLVAHYAGNRSRLGPEFDSIVETHIKQQGREYLLQLGDLAINVPTVTSIQNSLAALIQGKLSEIGFIAIWPPKAPAGLPLPIEARVKVLADAMALAINPGAGADENALNNFIPATRDLAFAISADGVKDIFEKLKRDQNPFHRYSGDSHDFDLKSLSLSLKPGALHFDGEMTVINAIAFSIDVDAIFSVDVHLNWDTTTKNRIIATPDTPDVHTKLSILAWVVSLILGFFTFGGMGVVIAIIVDKVCEAVAANIGTDIVKDPNFTTVAGWPSELPKIGEVEADFDNPIEINTDGLLFSATVAP